MTAYYNFYSQNLQKVYCFSDEEGGNPFKFDQKYDGDKEMMEDLTTENGMITGLKPNVGLIYLGDVQDNGPYSISLLKNMVKMKENFPERVILIAGNRDINKIRFVDECLINGLTFDSNKTFQETLNELISGWVTKNPNAITYTGKYNFKFGADVLNKSFCEKVFGKQLADNKPFENINDHERIKKIYANTMGAQDSIRTVVNGSVKITMKNAVYYIFDNMVSLGIVDTSNDDKYICLAVTLMNMIMSKTWENVPSDVKDYNGLYIRYLQKAHICAIFNYRRRHSFVSHAGIPEKSKFFSSYLGKVNSTTNTSTFIKDVVIEMDTIFKEQLANINVFDNNAKPLREQIPYLKHLIDMSAPCGLIDHKSNLNDKVIPADEYTSDLSPIVAFTDPAARKQPVKYAGSYANLSRQDGTAFEFNIYGHQPRGLMPSVALKEGTYHICMDVSKIEGQTNNDSYVMLVIPVSGLPRINGKIKPVIKEGKIDYYIQSTLISKFNFNKALKSGKRFYYSKDIKTDGTFDKQISFKVTPLNSQNTQEEEEVKFYITSVMDKTFAVKHYIHDNSVKNIDHDNFTVLKHSLISGGARQRRKNPHIRKSRKISTK